MLAETARARGRPRGDQGDGRAVTSWTGDELARIGAADELELAALRRDGTLRKPVTLWVASSVGIDAYWLDSKIRYEKGHYGWMRGAKSTLSAWRSHGSMVGIAPSCSTTKWWAA